MKNIIPTLFIIVVLSTLGYGQAELPDKGSLSDIVGKTKVYLAVDTENLKWVTAEFNKQKKLQIVNKVADADFFIEYKRTELTYASSLHLPVETRQLDVYFYRDKQGNRLVRKWIRWLERSQWQLN